MLPRRKNNGSESRSRKCQMSNILRHEYTVIAANPASTSTLSQIFDSTSVYEDSTNAPAATEGKSSSQVPKECVHI